MGEYASNGKKLCAEVSQGNLTMESEVPDSMQLRCYFYLT